MPLRRWLLLLIGLAGLGLFVVGILRYTAAWSVSNHDPASMMAAGRASMRALPVAALGVALVTAAGIAWWRDRG